MIKKFFHGSGESKLIKRIEDLNPYLIRFLKCVQMVEVSHLHEKFKGELTEYLHFLLRFSNSVESFRKMPTYRKKKLDTLNIETSKAPLLRMIVQTERIRYFEKLKKTSNRLRGMLAFKMRISKLKPAARTYDITSTPKLTTVTDELYNILNCICEQFQGIPKVETVLYK